MIRTHYLDASAIVKLFVTEAGSKSLRDYMGAHSTFTAIAPCFIEALSVMKGKHRRGDLTEEAYLSACEKLVSEIRDQTIGLEDIQTDRATYDKAESLAKKHKIDLIDAYQLYILKNGFFSQFSGSEAEPILITADKPLANAARNECMRVWHCVDEDAP
jgi:predicted nucleic acid-binding protein